MTALTRRHDSKAQKRPGASTSATFKPVRLPRTRDQSDHRLGNGSAAFIRAVIPASRVSARQHRSQRRARHLRARGAHSFHVDLREISTSGVDIKRSRPGNTRCGTPAAASQPRIRPADPGASAVRRSISGRTRDTSTQHIWTPRSDERWSGLSLRMCNLCSITTNQAAIAALFRIVRRY